MILWPEVPQPWSLQAFGRGQVLVLMMQVICLPPGRVQVGVHSPIFPPPGFMTPDRSTVTLLPTAQEGLQVWPGLLGSQLLLPCVRVCTRPCVHPSEVEPLFPTIPTPVCGAPTVKPHWPSKPDLLRAPPSNARPLDWGA